MMAALFLGVIIMSEKDLSFSIRLRDALSRADITQAELARRSGVSESSLSRYMKGDWRPSLATLGKIAKALGTNVYEMIGPDWSGIDMSDAFAPEAEAKKEPAPIAGSGSNWDRLLSIFNQLSPEDQAELVSVAEKFAKASQHK